MVSRLSLLLLAPLLVGCRATPSGPAAEPTAEGRRADPPAIELYGKRFRIVRMSFRDEEVEITGCWAASDGTLLFTDYLGPVEPFDENALSLSSAPPRALEQLVTLLLSDDPSAATSPTICERLVSSDSP